MIAPAIDEIINQHSDESLPPDSHIDKLLGLQIPDPQAEPDLCSLLTQYGGEQRVYRGDIPYDYIKRLYYLIYPLGLQSFLDLGCGYGRILAYGSALLPSATFYGIELVHERVKCTKAWIENSQQSNVFCDQGDILELEWPDADCLFVLNSLSPSLMPKLLTRIKQRCQERETVIVSIWSSNLVFESQSWLKEITNSPINSRLDPRIFVSSIY